MSASEEQKKNTGLKRLWLATLNSRRSLLWLARNEAAFREELLLLVVMGGASFFFDITVLERCALIVSLLVTLLVETLNTAIETTIDRIGLHNEVGDCDGLLRLGENGAAL